MTARTHDLFAFTALTITPLVIAIPAMSFATAISSVVACFFGGLAPDLDEESSDAWKKIPAGSLLAKLIDPLLGGHRWISHSLLGMGIFGIILHFILQWAKTFLLVDTTIVLFSFLIGMASHLVADGITKEGIPLLFPIPWKIGFPPLSFLRVKTGSWVEKYLVFPSLVLINLAVYLLYTPVYLRIFSTLHK